MGKWTERLVALGREREGSQHCGTPISIAIVNVPSVPNDDGDNEAVAWRLEAFRARIPAHGPIWPPRLRDDPRCDTPGHCSLCGDVLPTDPAPKFPRCQPCVRALTLALNALREDVPRTQEVR